MRGIASRHARVRAVAAVTVLLAVVVMCAPASIQAVGDNRTLSFYNVNTEETLTVDYKKNGRYVSAAMRRINHMMRDWRRNDATRIDPKLIDLIWDLHTELGSNEPVHLISGYRSQKTNESLRRKGGGQAKKSRHITGQAADVHFPDISAKQLRNSALIRERGGVGYYPGSQIPFVHLDTGSVRHWPRLPRQELAELFPSGRTAHRPADGRPLTQRDGQRALARLRARGESPRTQLASAASPPPVPSSNPERAAPGPAQSDGGRRIAAASLASSPVRSAPDPTAARSGSPLPWRGGTDMAEAPATPAVARFATADLGLTASFESVDTPGPAASGFDAAMADGAGLARPQDLIYRPYPVLALMTESGAGPRHVLTEMTHPEQDRVAVLLTGRIGQVASRFQQGPAAAAQAPGPRFTGPAVPNFAAASQAVAPRGKFL